MLKSHSDRIGNTSWSFRQQSDINREGCLEKEGNVSTVEFSVEYDGPSLDEHVMDLQILGPALMAINDLCREANRVLNGDDVMNVRVDMKATAEGCFNITLQLTELMQGASALLPVVPASQIVTALGLVKKGIGLLPFLKWQQGREIVRQETTDQGVSIQVKGDNNHITVIPPEVNKLRQNLNVRMAQWKFVSPLEEPGIAEIRLRDNREVVGTIQKEELQNGYYDVRPEEVDQTVSLSSPQIIDTILQLRAAVFEKDRKWQFIYGGAHIFAAISDTGFLASVFDGGRKFGVNDYLKVRMQITQEMHSDGRIQNNYEVIQVIDVVSGMEQVVLLGDRGDDENT